MAASSAEPTSPPTPPKAGKPAPPPAKPRVIPARFGDTTGEVFIGQRTVIDRYAGWGWLWKENETWRKARWVILKEDPGVIFAPGRFLGHPDRDHGNQYKLYGQWADFKAYEPNYDVFVDVFEIKGFELIGPGTPIKLDPPRSGRSGSSGSPFSRRNIPR
ncbi:MAG: hypothetical protein HC904_10885 [Blastochloris sp.]|nr:hypothetical protein [Blastochloris sp.]